MLKKLYKNHSLRNSNELFVSSWKNLSSNYKSFLAVLGASILGLLILFFIFSFIEIVSSNYFDVHVPTLNQYLSVKLPFLLISYLVLFTLAAFVNSLLVCVSLGKNVQEAVQTTTDNFIQFLLLSIVLGIIGIITISPLIALIVVVLAQTAYVTILSTILLALLIVFTLLSSIWFFSAPYLLLDKNLSVRKAVQVSFKKVRSHEVPLLGRMILLFVVLFTIQMFIGFISTISSLATFILNISYILIVIPFTYSFLKELYQDIT